MRCLAGRASIFWHSPPGVASVLLFVSAKMTGTATHPTFGPYIYVSGWGTSFRRTSFVVQTKICYCETTITNTISFWCQQLPQFVRKFVSQNKAKNAGRSGKNAGMREIRQNTGFPARLRDGWHICWRFVIQTGMRGEDNRSAHEGGKREKRKQKSSNPVHPPQPTTYIWHKCDRYCHARVGLIRHSRNCFKKYICFF